jgi:hypothetical protein
MRVEKGRIAQAPNWTKKKDARLTKMVADLESVVTIAIMLHVSQGAVQYRMGQLGLSYKGKPKPSYKYFPPVKIEVKELRHANGQLVNYRQPPDTQILRIVE